MAGCSKRAKIICRGGELDIAQRYLKILPCGMGLKLYRGRGNESWKNYD